MLLLFFHILSVFLMVNEGAASSHKCENILDNHPCTSTSSDRVMVPNLLSQTQTAAINEMSVFPMHTGWSGCGVHFNDFICSIYAPSCSNNSNFPIPPCRDLCKQVKSDCSRHQIPWPAALDCDKFPVEGGYCKCYNGSSWSTKDIKIESDSGYVCEDIVKNSICKELTNQTVLPNFLNQTNQDDALAHINQYIPLIKVKCSSDFRLFLCSLYFPKCNGDDPPTPPCKSLCESAKNGCEPLIKKFGFSWPHEFNCDKFGSENCLKSAKDKILVTVPSGGQIRGSSMKTRNHGHQIYSFRGIPYAQPPIGNLRFRPPVAKRLTPSKKPFDATQDGPECIQRDPMLGLVLGKEDCLVLNVYTRNINTTSRRPVMVFMHGGGFAVGSGSSSMYSPRRLLDHDIVLVTINYRLHLLGFLSTNDDASPGNYGLLDQTEALKWVRDNIEAFGGDPNVVNIFGESAGSASVLFHPLSPHSTGLFHSVIAQSGSPLCPWTKQKFPYFWAKKLAEDVGCTTHNTDRMMRCLRLMPVQILILEMSKYSDTLMTPFRPVVDGYFLPNSSYDLLKHGDIVNKVPIMMGLIAEEGELVYEMLIRPAIKRPLKLTDKLLTSVIALALSIKEEEVNQEAIDLLRKEYFHSVDPNDAESIRDIIIKIISYSMFAANHFQTVQLLSEHGVEPFVYSFELVTNQSIAQFFGIKNIKKPTHGDDVFFLFFDRYINAEIEQTEDTLLQMWTKFAEFGHPTKYLDPTKTDVPEWPRSKQDDIQIYNLDYTFGAQSYNPNNDKYVKFWIKELPLALESSSNC